MCSCCMCVLNVSVFVKGRGMGECLGGYLCCLVACPVFGWVSCVCVGLLGWGGQVSYVCVGVLGLGGSPGFG